MKKLTMASGIVMSVLLQSAAVQAEVPHIFTPETTIKATEVNANFDHLATAIEDLNANSIGANLIDGEREISVDCTSDPVALNSAYAENVQYSNLNFEITGNCYGDIRVKRDLDDEGVWTGSIYQPMGQHISIFPASDAEGNPVPAGLIPNDLTGSVTVWGGFGGSLYLSNISVTLGEGWDMGAAYSRNGQGGVTNVTMIGNVTNEGYGVFVQEGAQVYIYNNSIAEVGIGIIGQNNASIRFLGTNTISAQWEAVLLKGSSLRQGGEVTVTSTNGRAIALMQNSTWIGQGQTINATSPDSNVALENGSNIMLGTLNATGNVFSSQSTMQINTLNAVNIDIVKGSLGMDGGTASGLHMYRSLANISNASISVVDLYQGSNSDFENVTVDTSLNASDNSIAQVRGTAKVDLTNLHCNGFAVVNYDGVDMLNSAAASNCLDSSALSSLAAMINAHRIANP